MQKFDNGWKKWSPCLLSINYLIDLWSCGSLKQGSRGRIHHTSLTNGPNKLVFANSSPSSPELCDTLDCWSQSYITKIMKCPCSHNESFNLKQLLLRLIIKPEYVVLLSSLCRFVFKEMLAINMSIKHPRLFTSIHHFNGEASHVNIMLEGCMYPG
jgi:hypothetical protein